MAMNAATSLADALGVSTEKIEKIKKKLLLQPLDVQMKKQVIALKYFATGTLSDAEYAKLIEGGVKASLPL